MRRTSPFPILTALALGAGCTAASLETNLRSDPPATGSASDASTRFRDDASDAAPAPASPNRGSPLCNINFTCSPDDRAPAECLLGDGGASSDAGSELIPDAGGFVDAAVTTDASTTGDGAFADGGGIACRVLHNGKEAAPTCAAAGNGEDGAECRASADCAAGFECVGTPGQCRRYCCLGSSSCASDRVCDKQIVYGAEIWVPVCIPIHPCKLLTPKACPENETCGIVDQSDGRTSCVAIGTAAEGESCELANCGAGLTCLGLVDERRCFKLCSKSASTDCPETHKCKGTTPLFQNVDHGVCLPDSASNANARDYK